MDAAYGHGAGGKLIKECREFEPLRAEVKNDEIAKKLWEFSEKQIERLEKQGAVNRALAKKEAEKKEKKGDKSKSTASEADGSATPGESKQTPGSRRSRKVR